MKKCLSAVALLAAGLVFVQAMNAGGTTSKIKSGPQVGGNARPKPFFPLNLNGPTPDEKQCLVCRNGNNPVAMVFARDTSPQLVSLIKKLDAATVKNAEKKMGSFAIFCNDAETLPAKLKGLAKEQGLKKFVLAVDNPAGPEPYNIAKDADVTVVLYNQSKVIANYTFRKGELKAADVDRIVADVSKIVK